MDSDRDDMERELNQAADPLSAYWNDLLQRGLVAHERTPAEIDPALFATVRRLHHLADTPAPPPELRDRLWQQLTASPAMPAGADRLSARPAAGANGRAPGSAMLWPTLKRGQSGGLWLLGQLALAAILLVTIIGGYLTFGPLRPGSGLDEQAGIPAIVATPKAMTVTPLADGSADALPTELDWIMMLRSTFRPGGRSSSIVYNGPNLAFVEAGALTYFADRPLVVTRAAVGDAPGQREMVPPGTEVVVGAGESVLVPLGATAGARNDGGAPAVQLVSLIEGPELSGGPFRSGSNVTQTELVVFHISDRQALPPTPATIRLSRVTLASEARFAPPQAAWWMLAVAEDAYPNVDQEPDGTAVNRGSDPIDLYLTTVEPAPVAASPAQGVTVTELAKGLAAELPAILTLAGVRRSTFAAGAQAGTKSYLGPNLAYVEAGTMTYLADHPLLVARATNNGEAGRREEVPAGTDAVLTAGDSVLIPLGATASARNDGTEVGVVATMALDGPGAAATAGSGVKTQPLSLLYTAYPRELPRAPAEITLTRVTLEPNGRFAPLPGSAWWLVAIMKPTDNTFLERRPDGSVVNLGPTRLSAYVVTVEAVPEGASMSPS